MRGREVREDDRKAEVELGEEAMKPIVEVRFKKIVKQLVEEGAMFCDCRGDEIGEPHAATCNISRRLDLAEEMAEKNQSLIAMI